VRDSANQSPQGSVTPGWKFTINSIDNGVCTDARIEIWSNGTLAAAIGNNTIGTPCTGSCNYLGTWAGFFITCNTGNTYTILQEKQSPTATTEVRMYYPSSNASFAWSINDRITSAVAASGTFNFSTVTTGYLTTGVQSKATGINQGTATFSCPTCPVSAWLDGLNGIAQFCPALATPGKYGFTYSFTVGSCSKSFTDTITVNSIYSAAWNSPGTVCASSAYNLNSYLSGAATPGGTWVGTNVSGNTFSPTSAGPVSITYSVSPGTACRVSETHTITVLASPTVAVTASGPVSYCAGTPVNLTFTASGADTYAWSTGESSTAITVTPITSQVYTVLGSTIQGCNKTQTVTVSFTPNPTSSISSQINVRCKGASTGAATIGAASGTPAYTYAWLPSSAGSNAVATGLAAGTYTAIVTDSQGCGDSSIVTITEPAAVLSGTVTAQSDASCGQSNGSATITSAGGTSPYTYSWSPSGGAAASASNLGAGSYVVTITDNNACTQNVLLAINNANGPNTSIASQSDPTCAGGTGSVSVTTSGGSAPYTYAWSNGSSTSATSGVAGTYSLTVTDAAGCTNLQIVTISQPAAVSISVNTTNASCAGSTGSATATVSGGTGAYTYLWSNGNATSAISAAAGTYTVTVTDVNGCSSVQTATIGAGAAITSSASGVDATCNFPNGTATVSASGGSGTFSYLWSNGSTSPTVSGLAAGNYSVTVTDGSGCTSVNTVTVNNAPNTIAASFTPDATSGTAPVSITFTNNSTGAATYTWSFGDGNSSSVTTPGHTYTASGTYTVTLIATSAAGCLDTAISVITVNAEPCVDFSIPNAFSPNGDGHNETFRALPFNCFKDMGFSVYNRWGNLMFSTTDVLQGWDGSSATEKECSEGVYFYTFKATFKDGTLIDKKGTVTLMR